MAKKRCIACAESIQKDALMCRYCGIKQDDSNFQNESLELNPQSPRVLGDRGPRKRLLIASGIIVGLSVVSVVLGVAISNQLAEDQRRAEAKASTEAWLAERELERKRQEEEASKQAEVNQRILYVQQIESSVSDLAKKHIREGVLSGKVLETNCTPISGYSLDNLDQSSTTFDCFVATKDNGDGTRSGYSYTAVMDWDSGSYTYKLGNPN